MLEDDEDENFDKLNFAPPDLSVLAEQNSSNESQALLEKVRMQQKLHEKAQNLLGRSFRNAIVH